METELVQIIVDCYWRLRRIQALEYALYAHGHDQFEEAFQDCPEQDRYTKILLQTNLTYEKQFRNYQIQEARLDRKRAKAMAELERLQAKRKAEEADLSEPSRDREQAVLAASANGFVFSNSSQQADQNRALEQAEVFSAETELSFSRLGAGALSSLLR
jgi:hypothetical protein